MRSFLVPLFLVALVGCAQHRPPTSTLMGMAPDCQNRDRQIRYLTELRQYEAHPSEDPYMADRKLDFYISRLKGYCQ
jgi:hypothetical protein